MSACRTARWAIPRSATSTSAPGAWSCRTCRASPTPSPIGDIARLPALTGLIARLKESGGTCHLMGLLSPGGVHSHQDHAAALARILDRGRHPRRHPRLHRWPRHAAPNAARAYPRRTSSSDVAGLERPIATRDRPLLRDGPRQPLGPRQPGLRRHRRRPRARASATAAGRHRGRLRPGRQDRRVHPPPPSIGDYAGMSDGDGVLLLQLPRRPGARDPRRPARPWLRRLRRARGRSASPPPPA